MPTTSSPPPADLPGLAEAIRFQRDLYLYWRLIAQVGGAPLTTRQQVARPLLRRLRERLAAGAPDASPAPPTSATLDLSEGEDLRLFFIRRLLERLSLLRVVEGEVAQIAADSLAARDDRRDAGDGAPAPAPAGPTPTSAPTARRGPMARLVAAPPALMARYLAHPLAERVRLCARLWAAGGWWPEAPDPQGAPPRLLAPAPPRIAVARRRLLATLADLEPGTPLSTPEHANPSPEQRRPVATRPRRRQPAALSVASQRREVAHPGARLGGEALGGDLGAEAALDGPLRWLGYVTSDAVVADATSRLAAQGDLVDLNRREDTRTQPGGLRVGLVALALRREFWPLANGQDVALAAGIAADEARLIERHGRLVAQSNLSLIAYPPLTAPELLTLDSCAREDGFDQTARYQLTRDARATARALGWGAASVAERLAALTESPLPANMRVTLADWERHVARARLIPAITLLETPDHTGLDAMLADPTARGWVARRLTPTAALLVAESLPLARGWLLRHGRLPAVTQLDPADGLASTTPV